MSSLNNKQKNMILTSMSCVVCLMSIVVGSKLVEKLSSPEVLTTPSQWEKPKQIAPASIGVSTSVLGMLLQDPQTQWKNRKAAQPSETEAEAVVASFQEGIPEMEAVSEVESEPKVWETPAWFQQESSEIHWILDELDSQTPKYSKGPKIKSRTAFIVDLDSGEVLWQKSPDTRRAVASLTKVISSLTLSWQDPDLETEVCLDHTLHSGFPGARTRLSASDCVSGWDVMGAALVSSDNGAAYAYPLIVDQSHEEFAMHMNEVAEELGMTESEFVDPAGVNDENISTARDLTKLAIVAAFDSKVSIPASASTWHIKIGDNEEVYSTTNVARSKANFLLAKTGYTHTARAGFTGVYQQNGRRIAFTILGGWYPSVRNRDMITVMNWVAKHP